MSVARSVADVLRDHVVLELEAIDRMYLNVYVPHLQTARAVVGYLHVHRGQRFASTTAVVPMSEAFVRNIEQFVAVERIDLVSFAKGEQGRCHAEVPAALPPARGRALRRQGAGEGAGDANGTAPQSPHRRDLSMDR